MKRIAPLLLVAASVAVAQNVIDFSKLPTCAQQQCTILQQANAICVPPAAPVTEQAIYQSCVCQSALLQELHVSGTVCQTAGCSPEDATKISQYYIELCNGPVVEPPEKPKETQTTLSTTTLPPTGLPTAGTGGAVTDPEKFNNNDDRPWIETHWKWIVMVVVIALAMVFFWVGGIYLRRHFERKKEAERANLAAKDAGSHNNTPPMASTSNTAMPEMSGGLNGNKAFGPTAPPPVQRRLSRSNTINSLRRNSSRTSIPNPVVWGPHQHLGNGRNSQNASGPPSPTSAIGQPGPFRNREGMRSDPRVNSYRSQDISNPPPLAPPADGARYTDSLRHPHTSHGGGDSPSSADWRGSDSGRPHTAFGDPIRETSSRRAHVSLQNDPNMTTHLEGQAAEFCETSPPPQKSTH